MPEIVIIGAGLTGLSTAYHLNKPYAILEKNEKPGGLSGSVSAEGYTFDYSGHFLHLHDPHTKILLDKIMPVKLDKIIREAAIFTNNSFVPYPFQANLFYLPEKIRKECLDGFKTRPRAKLAADKMNFLAWSNYAFGKGITKYFMKPYNEKLWTVPAKQLGTDWLGPFVPRPKVSEIIRGAKDKQTKDFGYNVSFYYPRSGGSQSLVEAFSDRISPIRAGIKAERISLKNKCLFTSDGKKRYYEQLVSTQPLVELVKNIHEAPLEVKIAAASLRWNSVQCFNLGFKNKMAGQKPAGGRHWLYFPEKKYIFYRAGIYSNIQPALAPHGCFSMYVEMSRRPEERFDTKRNISAMLDGLADAGIIEKGSKPETICSLNLPFAYVIYDNKRAAALKVINNFLKKNGIYSIGRYGGWEYSFMESSIIEGRNTAAILNRK